MRGAYALRPWTDVVRPHRDVASGDLAMGTYAANLGGLAERLAGTPSLVLFDEVLIYIVKSSELRCFGDGFHFPAWTRADHVTVGGRL